MTSFIDLNDSTLYLMSDFDINGNLRGINEQIETRRQSHIKWSIPQIGSQSIVGLRWIGNLSINDQPKKMATNQWEAKQFLYSYDQFYY